MQEQAGARAKGATWSSAKSITPAYYYSSYYPAMVLDAANVIYVVWGNAEPGNYEIHFKRSTNEGSTWSSAKRISWTSGDSWNPTMAVDSSRTLHVAWHDDTPGNKEIYYKLSKDQGTMWTGFRRITWTPDESAFPAIAVDSGYAIFVVWHDAPPGLSEVYYRKGY